MQPTTLLSEIRAKLDQLEAMLCQQPANPAEPEEQTMPPADPSQDTSEPLYNMFGTKSGDDSVEEDEETDGEDDDSEHEDDDFVDVDLSDVGELIGADKSDNDIEEIIYQAVEKVNKLVGITPKELSDILDLPLATVKRVTQEMFFADRLEKVHLRPISYRVR